MLMQDRLKEIVAIKYQLRQCAPEPARLLGSQHHNEIKRIYNRLQSGTTLESPLRLGNYDISSDDFDIELDEYLHFNRYRRITLESAIYDKLLKFPLALYNEWCEPDGVAEQKCLQAGSYGGKWHNGSTDRQFGISNVPGNLSGNGSSRWKQRAFNDYRKDVLPLLTNRPLVRISIYDKIKTNIGELAVGQILNAPDFMAYSAPIIALIESRLFNIEK